MNKIKITITGFKKFNPRSDLKSMPWLRLQNDFYDKEDFYDQTLQTTHLFIFLLCQCAQKVSETLEMDEKYLVFKSKLTKSEFSASLKKLSDKGLISLETNESDRIRTDPLLTNEQNEQNGQNRTRSKTDRGAPLLSTEEILSCWNASCKKYGLAQVRVLSVSRKKKLAIAMKSFKKIDDWKMIFTVAAAKGFIGKDGREFIPSWDYIFRNDNYIKFHEEFTIEEIPKSKQDTIKEVEAFLFKDL